MYQDMPQPAPPPIPVRFPGQDPEPDMYASIDNKPNGYFEMSVQRSVLSSTGSSGYLFWKEIQFMTRLIS